MLTSPYPPPSKARKLAASILSAFVWNKEARRAFRNALLRDYNKEIKELREQIDTLRDEMKVGSSRVETKPVASSAPRILPYHVEGRNNRITIIEEGKERLLGKDERIPGLELSIVGNDNEVRIHRPSVIYNSKIQIGQKGFMNNGARVELGKNVTFCAVFLRINAGEKQHFRFGHNSRIWGGEVILDETSGCLIGDDVNCSNNIHIWGSDAHAILDKNNPSKVLNEVLGPITVGDHTWIGQAVRLQKNARIPANSIVAAAAVVTKAFDEEYTIIAGFPAKVIKRDVMREPETKSAFHLRKEKEQK